MLAEDFGNFKIIDLETEAFIGLAKLSIVEKEACEAELGYMLLPKYWGQGIAGAVGKMLTDNARKHPSIRSVVAYIDPKNIPSRKILTNNGFMSTEFRDFDGLPGEVLRLQLA